MFLPFKRLCSNYVHLYIIGFVIAYKYALLLGSIPSEIEDQVTRTVGQSVFETHRN